MLGLGASLNTSGAIEDTAFTPGSISNLVLWLKVHTNIEADADGSNPASDHSTASENMEDLDRISAWNAFGDTTINAVQATSGDKPKWETDSADIGGINVLSGKFMDLSETITVTANTDFTIVVRCRPTDLSAQRTLMGNTATEHIKINSTTVIRLRADGDSSSPTNTDFTSGTAMATDKYITILIVRSDDSTGNINIYVRGEDSGYFDGTAAGTAWGSEAQLAEQLIFSNLAAANDDNLHFRGFIKDVLLYNGTAVNASQREQLFDYIEAQDY